MCKISVIVPIYNSEYTLIRCIDSILAQTFSDFELLLINDGSSDNSGVICDEYKSKDQRVRVFHQHNKGVSSARNVGIENAKGKWITFCDADDYVFPNWLEIYVENCRESDLVVQGYVTDESKTPVGVNYTGNAQGAFGALAQNSMLGFVWVKLFRRDIICQNGFHFREDSIFREDEEFVLRYLNVAGNVTCVKNGAYMYDMPDLRKKYRGADNFYCSCSMFYSVQKLMGSPFDKYSKTYLEELNNALFQSFAIKKGDRCKRLAAYQQAVGRYVMHSQLNVFSKLILLMVRCPKIASWIFDFKVQLKNMNKVPIKS